MYLVDVSEVLIRYRRLLRAMHQTFARTTRMNKTKKVEVVATVDPMADINNSQTVYMSLWGWLVRALPRFARAAGLFLVCVLPLDSLCVCCTRCFAANAGAN